jgi:hypothetical protein
MFHLGWLSAFHLLLFCALAHPHSAYPVAAYLPEYRPADLVTSPSITDIILFSLEPTSRGSIHSFIPDGHFKAAKEEKERRAQQLHDGSAMLRTHVCVGRSSCCVVLVWSCHIILLRCSCLVVSCRVKEEVAGPADFQKWLVHQMLEVIHPLTFSEKIA